MTYDTVLFVQISNKQDRYLFFYPQTYIAYHFSSVSNPAF